MEPVYRDAEGNFGLNLSSAALERILWMAGLRAPRFAAPAPSPVLAPPGDEIPISKDELDAAFRERFISGFSALRRAVLRAAPVPGNLQALALLDVGAHSVRTFIGDAIAAVPDALSGFDLLAGLQIRETLHVLRLDPDRWRLVDLRPPQKSRRINRAGRTLKIRPELLIWSTTGIGRPLGDPDKVAGYLARGEAGKPAAGRRPGRHRDRVGAGVDRSVAARPAGRGCVSVLDRLKPGEAESVLRRLPAAHPDLGGEAEQIAPPPPGAPSPAPRTNWPGGAGSCSRSLPGACRGSPGAWSTMA
jgi:hypothetical protein